MQSNVVRAGMLAGVIVAAVVLFVVLSGDDDEGGNGGAVTTSAGRGGTVSRPSRVITVRNGGPVGGVETLTYDKGDPVDIEVRLDQPEEEVHVHGYEIDRPAENSPVRLSFTADIDGVFEVEVHRGDGSEAQIAELRVNP
jgi:hypothetical protein